MSRGFTLIEILIVISIVGIMLSVVMPVSYSMYKTYQESLEAEKVLIFLSSLKRESFLYSKERLVDTKDGKLIVDGSEKKEFKDIFIHAERPILFYKNGTTSGGKLGLNMKSNIFVIAIDPPLGEMRLTRQ